MQFYVPQFIDVEDKIFGPLTFKQFVYLVGGAGACVALWVFLPNFIALILIAPVIALSVALAFYQVNNKPFIYMVEAAIRYVTNARLYIWKKQPKNANPDETSHSPTNPLSPTLSSSKLKDMSWNLDVQDSIYSQVEGGTQNAQRNTESNPQPAAPAQNQPSENPPTNPQQSQPAPATEQSMTDEGSQAESAAQELGLKSVGPTKTGPESDL